MLEPAREELFEKVFREQATKIFRWVYKRCGSREVSQDVTSECFIRTFERYSGSETDITRILFRVADNLLKDHFRERLRKDRLADRLRTERDEQINPSPETDAVEAEDEGATVSAAGRIRSILEGSQRLNENHKRYLFMRLFQNKMPKEIASELSTDYVQVKNYLQYGLKILKEELKR